MRIFEKMVGGGEVAWRTTDTEWCEEEKNKRKKGEVPIVAEEGKEI